MKCIFYEREQDLINKAISYWVRYYASELKIHNMAEAIQQLLIDVDGFEHSDEEIDAIRLSLIHAEKGREVKFVIALGFSSLRARED